MVHLSAPRKLRNLWKSEWALTGKAEVHLVNSEKSILQQPQRLFITGKFLLFPHFLLLK